MIKAEDLRIGNRVYFSLPTMQRPTIVMELGINSCVVNDKDLTLELFYESEELKPIPLIPSWLERAGYAWSGGDHWEDKSGKIWIEDRAGLYRICKPFLGIYKIEFVHQFQNTIYINFGNELIFNP